VALITDQQFAARKAEIQQQLKDAERTYGAAALAAAVGKGDDEDQRLAKDTVDHFRDQLTALDAAWKAAQAERRVKAHEDKIAAFEGSCEEVARITAEAVAAAEEIEELVAKVRAIVEAYSGAYSRVQAETRRHKLDLTGHQPGQLVASAVADLNRNAAYNMNLAGSAIGGLRTLQGLIVNLPGQARDAMRCFAPKPIEREDA
jgi:hypothetical protein